MDTETVGGVEVIWCYPHGADNKRTIVYTHGGGFAVGSADSHRKLVGHLAKALGVTAINVDYRRAPEHPFPSQIDDVISVVKELLSRGFHAANLTMAGDSAGANLAIASVLRLKEMGSDLPGAVIAFSPWLDMALRGPTLHSNAATDYLVNEKILSGMIDMYLGEDGDRLNPLANPLEADLSGFPRLYINAGETETLLSDAQALYQNALSAGVKATLSVVPAMQHVFVALAGRAPEADEELNRIASWHSN